MTAARSVQNPVVSLAGFFHFRSLLSVPMAWLVAWDPAQSLSSGPSWMLEEPVGKASLQGSSGVSGGSGLGVVQAWAWCHSRQIAPPSKHRTVIHQRARGDGWLRALRGPTGVRWGSRTRFTLPPPRVQRGAPKIAPWSPLVMSTGWGDCSPARERCRSPQLGSQPVEGERRTSSDPSWQFPILS